MRVIILTLVLAFASSAFAKEIKVLVKGMVCAFCAQGVTKKFKVEPEVSKVDVSLEKKSVTLQIKEGKDIEDKRIKEILEDAGYEVEKIERSGN